MGTQRLAQIGGLVQQAVVLALCLAGAGIAFRRWPAKGTGLAIAGFLLVAASHFLSFGI